MKNFIIDTSVILHDPKCLFQFADSNVVLIFQVLEELDSFKKAHGVLGHNCREAIRFLEELRNQGSLQEGVKLDNGGMLKVIQFIRHEQIPKDDSVDNKLLATAKNLGRLEETVLITKDINLRVKADSLSILTEDYAKDKVENLESYKGWDNVIVKDVQMKELLCPRTMATVIDNPEEYVQNGSGAIGRFDTSAGTC